MKLVEDKTFGCETVTSGVLSKFAKTHGLPTPIRVPVRTKGLTGSGDDYLCHLNSLVLAYRYGGTLLSGFIRVRIRSDGDDNKYSVLLSHSVWVTPEGNAVCPTLHNDIYINPEQGVQFIPCFENDEFAVRDYFESGLTPIVVEDVIHCLRDRSYVVYKGTTPDLLVQLGEFTRMSTKEWKQTVKTYEKRGVGGTRNSPLRKRLLTKPAFRKRLSLDNVLQHGGTDFMRKVLPNLKSSAALSC